ncbi:hypothetical protein CHS0354_028523 [Potamilus streckersoni]|uniref:Uncharacterized protein n=1 Tax=Potamilus streckersoni TaxID=2493646 RepID=A0AAE0RMW3_9BIVA|nr:hypothetical protein CHS0354_028523 [Potamilus streckersoni]
MSVCNLFSTSLVVVSRKTWFELEISAVNFIEGWKLFAFEMKSSRLSLPYCHFISISSIKRTHWYGVRSTDAKSFPSSFPMKMLAYEGAILVPIAVPLICR